MEDGEREKEREREKREEEERKKERKGEAGKWKTRGGYFGNYPESMCWGEISTCMRFLLHIYCNSEY